MRTTKSQNLDSIDSKINCLMRKMSNNMDTASKQMEALKRQAVILLQKSQQDIMAYENEAQSQLKQLDKLSQELNSKIQKQVLCRKEKQNQLLAIIDEKSSIIKKQIENQKRIRQTIFLQISGTLQKDLPVLMDTVIQSAEERQTDYQQITQASKNDFSQCKQQLQQISGNAQINDKKFYDLIQDLTLKVKKELEQQRTVRQKTHLQILAYVEQTCNKLDADQ